MLLIYLSVGGILGYCVYQLFWYYPKQMRALFGLDRKSKKQTKMHSVGSEKVLAARQGDSGDHLDAMFNKSQKIAHRGMRLEGLPENSIAAFTYALKKGKADVIECDVWLTKDGHIIIHHDETLLRMTGVDKHINEVNYADLPRLRTDIEHQCEKIPEYLSTIENNPDHISKIPTLQEILELLPSDKYIDIEFKQLSTELIEKVNDMIYRMKVEKRVYWFSLDEKINKQLRLYDDRLPSIVSIQNILSTMFFYYIGILPFIDLPDKVFGITLEKITLEKVKHEKATKDLPEFLQKIIAWVFQGSPPKVFLAEKLFMHLRRRGIPVWFLGVNTEEDLLLALNIGATAVFTDKIEWLDTTLEKIRQSTGKTFKKLYE